MAGVYISYPFCAQKCTYCNFASGVFPAELEQRYTDALLAEIDAVNWPWTPETVYLGGGTPSRIPPATFRRILERIPGRPWKEATIEAAPGGIAREAARAWRAAGIDRASLGVQSFVEPEIRRTGRKHTAEAVVREAALLREAGIGKINIDLIAGLAGQTLRTWYESLEWIGKIRPDHVSVYMLEVDQDSRLGRELLSAGTRYGAREVAAEEDIVRMYEAAVERLAELGLRRYEISNFALPGYESRHNLKYWRREPYLGFGPDAHSFDGRTRWQNVESAEEYVARMVRRESVVESREPADSESERFFLGLRLAEGMRPGAAAWERHGEALRRFIEAGLLAREGETLRLTPRGILLSNEVFEEFVGV